MTNKFAVSEEITHILEAWIETGHKKRLSVLPASTGSGKSHAIASLMGKNAAGESGRTMIYLVHTTDNLSEQYQKTIDLHPDAKSATLLLKEDARMLMDFFASDHIEAFEKYPEYAALRAIVTPAIRRREDERAGKIGPDEIDHMAIYRDPINQKKKALQRRLRDEYQALPQSKRAAFLEETARIFPTADLLRYRAIFLTVKKFLFPLWTLQGSGFLYEWDFHRRGTPKDARPDPVLVIDEFDAQKNHILDQFASEAAQTHIDKIALFLNAHHTLKEATFLRKYGLPDRFIDSLIERFHTTHTQYVRGFSFVYQDRDRPIEYLLQSELTPVMGTRELKLTIRRDEAREVNVVEDGNDHRFSEMMRAIEGSIRYLVSAGKYAVRYQWKIFAEKKEKGEISFVDWVEERDKVLHQFIGEFNLNPSDSGYAFFERQIIESIHRSGTLLGLEREDFYTHGFSVMRMEHTDEDAKRSSFGSFSMERTPESFLTTVGAKFHIIGISATATIETVIKNFDLRYLKNKLDVQHPSPDEIERLNRLYVEGKRQNQRLFHVDILDTERTPREIAERWFGGDPRAARMIEGIFRGLGGDEESARFYQRRYIRLLYLYWQFITNPDIHGMLVLLNGHPASDRAITPDNLAELFGMMLMLNRDNPEVKERVRAFATRCAQEERRPEPDELFAIAQASDKGKKAFTQAQERLSGGGSAFVISAYATMGAGRNIQYMVTADGKEREKDYDAIYCEKPTNLLVRFLGDDAIKSLLKLLYQVHALYVSEEKTKTELYRDIRHAITVNEQSWRSIKYNGGDDYNNAVMQTIIQAIGRLHRVNHPDDPMYIFLDEGLVPIIRWFDPSGHALLPSVKKVLDTVKDGPETPATTTAALAFTTRTARRSRAMERKIRRMLSAFGRNDKEVIAGWEAIRAFILSHPTLPEESGPFAHLYTPPHPRGGNAYGYRAEDDYNEIEVSLVLDRPGFAEVSAAAARLDVLTRLPQLRPLFDEGTIAGAFEHPHLLLPVVFNNLYKGALGEEVGKFILENILGTPLRGIDPQSGFYEFFDFLTDREIAIDFKYYTDGYAGGTTLDALLEGDAGAIAKRKAMGVGRAVIINLIYDGSLGETIDRTVRSREEVYVVPYMIDASDPAAPFLDLDMLDKLRELLR